jgi:flagellum-specific peptidoglycan hydrolase FlgJ
MIIVKAIFLIAAFMFGQRTNNVQPVVANYIEEYKYVAIDEMVRTGIPASVTMAQAIIESNAGNSKLAILTNNHFGIKCKSYWEGMQYFHPDDDRDSNGNLIPSCFRKYPTVNDSYLDHSEFLLNTEHYKPLFSYDRTEYKLWAEGLELCGYASDCQYAEKLIKTIEAYGLHELDYYTIEYVDPSTRDLSQDLISSKNN